MNQAVMIFDLDKMPDEEFVQMFKKYGLYVHKMDQFQYQDIVDAIENIVDGIKSREE